MTGQNPFADDEKVEITADIDSATQTHFYVNGQKAFTAITGMSYLPSEIKTFGTVQQPFRTRGYIHMILRQTVSPLELEADLIWETDIA